jgi:hypothetical protein
VISMSYSDAKLKSQKKKSTKSRSVQKGVPQFDYAGYMDSNFDEMPYDSPRGKGWMTKDGMLYANPFGCNERIGHPGAVERLLFASGKDIENLMGVYNDQIDQFTKTTGIVRMDIGNPDRGHGFLVDGHPPFTSSQMKRMEELSQMGGYIYWHFQPGNKEGDGLWNDFKKAIGQFQMEQRGL